jgi:hypothetical protein
MAGPSASADMSGVPEAWRRGRGCSWTAREEAAIFGLIAIAFSEDATAAPGNRQPNSSPRPWPRSPDGWSSGFLRRDRMNTGRNGS